RTAWRCRTVCAEVSSGPVADQSCGFGERKTRSRSIGTGLNERASVCGFRRLACQPACQLWSGLAGCLLAATPGYFQAFTRYGGAACQPATLSRKPGHRPRPALSHCPAWARPGILFLSGSPSPRAAAEGNDSFVPPALDELSRRGFQNEP